MICSQARIEANRRYATRSTGPSPEGLTRTRLNATRHGLASKLAETVADRSPEFEQRRAKWKPLFQPNDETAELPNLT